MSDHLPCSAERMGRRLGIGAFIIIITSFIAVAGTQVLRQGFGAPAGGGPTPINCRMGVLALLEAVDRAALAPRDHHSERHRLIQFRESLSRTWSSLAKVQQLCSADPSAVASVRAVERYRYAVEESVRVSSTDLSPSRAAVHQLRQALRSNTADPVSGTKGP